MPSGVFKRGSCRLCEGKSLELVVPMSPTPIADAYVTRDRIGEVQEMYPLDLYFCHGCAHLQLLDVVDPNLMFRSDYTYLSGNSGGMVKHFREYAASVLRRENPPSRSLVVDVGSNDGTFLRPFQETGMRVLGIDPASDLARRATASGIETLPRFLDTEFARELRNQRGPARIVTANNVFAHADNLGGMADSIRVLLAEDGLFAFEVSYLVDVVDNMLLGTIFHEHLCYHTVKPLKGFLALHGLELVDVERVTIQGGSLIGYAQLAGGPRPVAARVQEAIRIEEERGFDRPETFHAFHKRIETLKVDMGNLLQSLKSSGKTLAGYGAARGGTTLIYRLDLGEHLRFIVDDSSEKQNLFSPGHHIPVLPAEALYERRPDYVFILAWIHARPILQKHQRYVEGGGHFIVAHPKIQCIGSQPEESQP